MRYFVGALVLLAATGLLADESKNDRKSDGKQLETTLPTVERSSGFIAKGMQFGLIAGFAQSAKLELESGSEKASFDDESFEQKPGIYIGYAEVKNNSIGFNGALNYARYEDDFNQDFSAIRVEGNLTFGLAEQVYVFGGANINKYIDADGSNTLDDFDPGFGIQLGGAFQFMKNLSAIGRYYTTNSEDERNGVDATLNQRGLELGVIYQL